MVAPHSFRASALTLAAMAWTASLAAWTSLSAEELTLPGAQASLIDSTWVATPIAGVIRSVGAREGTTISEGTWLVTLDDQLPRTELAAANAALQAAQLESENDVDRRYAEKTLAVRQRELAQSEQANQRFQGTVSDSELDKLRLVVSQSQLAIEQAKFQQKLARSRVSEKQAAMRIAEAKLRQHTLVAPVSGTIAKVDARVGEWVEQGKPLVRLISSEQMRVECFVDAGVSAEQLVGRAVEFVPDPLPRPTTSPRPSGSRSTQSAPRPSRDQAPPKPIQGHVTFISPELEPVSKQARLWATIDNRAGRVRAGMKGTLIIQSSGD
ncbi:MAG: HlyD family efflux transporter periplasmic adaptor subunit [Planctomycetota bacterium]